MTVIALINLLLFAGVVIGAALLLATLAKKLRASPRHMHVLGSTKKRREVEIIEMMLDEDDREKEEAAAIKRLEEVLLSAKSRREKA
jgi:hypothetical protein